MRVVVAPDSFKETLSARQAARAIAEGIHRAGPGWTVDEIPVADGGEGTAEVLLDALGGEWVTRAVTGPLGEQVEARFAWLADTRTAIIDMAAASGLALLSPERRDPGRTTTRGTGELIREAVALGARRVVVGLGGSATVDGGTGAARALGVRFLDESGTDLPEGGLALAALARIDQSGMDPAVHEVRLEAACDVHNPLLGPDGAARVFGPQKGATPGCVTGLEVGLARLAEIIARDCGVDVTELAGGGAAGGLGAGLAGLMGATLVSGAVLVLEAVGLEKRLTGVDLVVTGEGCLDGQTVLGKAPGAVARLAAERRIPVVGIGGILGGGAERLHRAGFAVLLSALERPVDRLTLKTEAARMVASCAEQMTRALVLGGRLGFDGRAWGDGRTWRGSG